MAELAELRGPTGPIPLIQICINVIAKNLHTYQVILRCFGGSSRDIFLWIVPNITNMKAGFLRLKRV